MVETYDIRLFSKYLSLVSKTHRTSAKSSHIAAILRGVVGDPLYVRVGELDQQLRQSGLGFAFAGWDIQRTYSEEKLARAELFLLKVPFTEVAAEEYGTRYQDLYECEPEVGTLEQLDGTHFEVVRKKVFCALWSKQISPLRVAFPKLRRNLDIYRLWGGELVVSERFVDLINTERFTGGAFFPIIDATDDNLSSPLDFSGSPAGLQDLSIAADQEVNTGAWDPWQWINSEEQRQLLAKMLAQQKSTDSMSSRRNLAQLVVRSKPIEVSEKSRFGETPFSTDTKDYHRCGAGIIAGRRLVSPLSVARSSWDGSDLCRTNVYIGGQRQGLFRPHQIFLVSKRLFDALRQLRMKGFQYEVAETV